jgi:hypothetical protein
MKDDLTNCNMTGILKDIYATTEDNFIRSIVAFACWMHFISWSIDELSPGFTPF